MTSQDFVLTKITQNKAYPVVKVKNSFDVVSVELISTLQKQEHVLQKSIADDTENRSLRFINNFPFVVTRTRVRELRY